MCRDPKLVTAGSVAPYSSSMPAARCTGRRRRFRVGGVPSFVHPPFEPSARRPSRPSTIQRYSGKTPDCVHRYPSAFLRCGAQHSPHHSGEPDRHRDRVLRLLHIRHGSRARARPDLHSAGRGGHTVSGCLCDFRHRVFRPADRFLHLRPFRRSARAQVDTCPFPALDGHLHHADRRAAWLCQRGRHRRSCSASCAWARASAWAANGAARRSLPRRMRHATSAPGSACSRS